MARVGAAGSASASRGASAAASPRKAVPRRGTQASTVVSVRQTSEQFRALRAHSLAALGLQQYARLLEQAEAHEHNGGHSVDNAGDGVKTGATQQVSRASRKSTRKSMTEDLQRAQASALLGTRERARMLTVSEVLLIFVALPLMSVVLLVAGWAIDQAVFADGGSAATVDGAARHVSNITTLFSRLVLTETEQVRVLLMAFLTTEVSVTAVIVTAAGIILQLSAIRYTTHVITLFMHEPFFLAALAFQLTASVLFAWIGYMISASYSPAVSTAVSTLAYVLSVLFYFPFFIYLFRFLEPVNVVANVLRDGIAALHDAVRADATFDRRVRRRQPVEQLQRSVMLMVDLLSDLLSTAVSQRNVHLATVIVDTLQYFTVMYGFVKDVMRDGWFRVPSWARNTPNFLALTPQAIAEMERRREFVEWKVMQKLLLFYSMVVHEDMPDLGFCVANATRCIALAAATRGDWSVVRLNVRFFNTFLRMALANRHTRFASTTLQQFRLTLDDLALLKDPAGHEISVQICRYLRYYAVVCLESELPVVAELIAHDVSSACVRAFRDAPPKVHQQLLDVLLTLDDMAEQEEDTNTLRGVRRAQIRVAAYYLYRAREDLARLIYEDMRDEPASRLQIIWQELTEQDTAEHFEVDDRGTSVDFIPLKHRPFVEVFFSWFAGVKKPRSSPAVVDGPGNAFSRSQVAVALGGFGTTAALTAAARPIGMAGRVAALGARRTSSLSMMSDAGVGAGAGGSGATPSMGRPHLLHLPSRQSNGPAARPTVGASPALLAVPGALSANSTPSRAEGQGHPFGLASPASQQPKQQRVSPVPSPASVSRALPPSGARRGSSAAMNADRLPPRAMPSAPRVSARRDSELTDSPVQSNAAGLGRLLAGQPHGASALSSGVVAPTPAHAPSSAASSSRAVRADPMLMELERRGVHAQLVTETDAPDDADDDDADDAQALRSAGQRVIAAEASSNTLDDSYLLSTPVQRAIKTVDSERRDAAAAAARQQERR